MKNKTRLMILISILLMVSISCQGLADVLPGGGANPSSFTAEASSAISVQLTWSAVEGAQKYLIERNDGETDYFPLGEISGEATTFEDFLVPPNTQISYRIKTVTASGTSAGKTVSLTTPQEFPNPLTVAAMFDTQKTQSQAIGPDGGSVSITDSRGVSYTLDIPAGAVDNEETFILTPIQEIQGLPLSGGMTSGVRIEPEGLIFNQSATLSIETTEPDGADDMMDMAFAFDEEGSEFHFVPTSSAAVTGAVFKLARPAGKGKMWNVPQTRSYGIGKGTSKDIRDQVRNHAPTSPADNLNQKRAAVENIQVQVVLDALLLNSGREVELQMAGASDWLEFTIALDTFKSWLEERDANKETLKKDQLDKREEAIWEALDLEARILLNTAYEDCKKAPPPPQNLAHAKRLVKKLLNGTTPFYRKFAEKMAKYSSFDKSVLETIKAKLDQCTPGWKATELNGVGVSGVICDLGQPFSIISFWYTKSTVNFTPSSPEAGSFSFEPIHFGDTDVSNTPGTYTVKGVGTDTVTITGTGGEVCYTDSGGTACFLREAAVFSLVPLDTNECGQP